MLFPSSKIQGMEELGESAQHVENVVRLLDEGNTIPFIAR